MCYREKKKFAKLFKNLLKVSIYERGTAMKIFICCFFFFLLQMKGQALKSLENLLLS